MYNPVAAALWFIAVTPFGAWIHTKNQDTLGKKELAIQNRGSAITVVVYVITNTTPRLAKNS